MLEMKEKTMKAQEKTSRLEDALTNVRTSQQREQFLKQYTEDGYDRFADYLNEYMAEHDIDLAELLCRSNISRNYVYNIINGDRNPGREKIIALCIGAGMNCSEINRALKIAQEGILYAKDESVHQDVPGMIALVTDILSRYGINIAQMTVTRENAGEKAIMIIEVDSHQCDEAVTEIARIPHLHNVNFFS